MLITSNKCNNQIDIPYFGPLPNIELDPHTWPCIVGCNEVLNSRFPNAIRTHGIAIGVSPVLCCGVPIFQPALHGVSQQLRRLLV